MPTEEIIKIELTEPQMAMGYLSLLEDQDDDGFLEDAKWLRGEMIRIGWVPDTPAPSLMGFDIDTFGNPGNRLFPEKNDEEE